MLLDVGPDLLQIPPGQGVHLQPPGVALYHLERRTLRALRSPAAGDPGPCPKLAQRSRRWLQLGQLGIPRLRARELRELHETLDHSHKSLYSSYRGHIMTIM